MSSTTTPVSEPATDLFASTTPGARQLLAWEDLRGGLAAWRLSSTLGWLDIKLRYRGSVLGPFWLTLSTAIMILAMGVLYSKLFRMDLQSYMPYLALSLVLWNTLSGVVADACVAFTSAEGTIRSLRMPFTIHAVRVMVRNAIILGHNVVVILAVFAWFDTWPTAQGWSAALGLLIWAIDSVAAGLLLGSFCARYRDIPPIVGSIMQIAFFLTPIIWQPHLIGSNAEWLVLNPFYPLLAVVRDPLLNAPPSAIVWIAAVVWSALLCAGAWVLFARVRSRLAFWV